MKKLIARIAAVFLASMVLASSVLAGTSISPTTVFRSDTLSASGVSANVLFKPMSIGGTEYPATTNMETNGTSLTDWYFENREAAGGETIYILLNGFTATATEQNTITLLPGTNRSIGNHAATLFSYIASGNCTDCLHFEAKGYSF